MFVIIIIITITIIIILFSIYTLPLVISFTFIILNTIHKHMTSKFISLSPMTSKLISLTVYLTFPLISNKHFKFNMCLNSG